MEQNIAEPKKKNRKKLVSIIIFLIILAAIGYFIWIEASDWWGVRKEYVKMGFAENKFPYRMYTEKELVEMGRWTVESQELINTPTRTRPEETYAKFRQALIDGDIDKASEYFIKEKREQWRKSLYEIKEKGFLQEMLDDLPERLEDTYEYEIRAGEDLNSTALMSYDYESEENGKWYSHVMSFEKDWNGDWFIEDL